MSVRLALVLAVLLAGHGSAAEPSHGRLVRTNPLYVGLLAPEPAAKAVQTDDTPLACDSVESLAAALREQSAARQTSFSIHLVYEYEFEDLGDVIDEALAGILAEDDYLRYTYAGYEASWRGYDGDATITFEVRYSTTAEQERYVDARVDELVGLLIEDGMTDERRQRAVHDWIVTHVEYDEAEASGDLRFTAYGALVNGVAVCQGYALLAYRLLDAAGLDVRMVSGTGNGEAHAWNLVRVCGAWYHMDATWDDPVGADTGPDFVSHSYFNLPDAAMVRDHAWDPAGFPEADVDYIPGTCSGETELLTWTSSYADAIDAASVDSRLLLLVAGRLGDTATEYVLNTVIQQVWPGVKQILRERFVVWFTDVDSSEEWHPYAEGMGTFTLPLVCVIDPVDSRSPYVRRAAGPQGAAELYAMIQEWAPADGPTAVQVASWGKLKRSLRWSQAAPGDGRIAPVRQ